MPVSVTASRRVQAYNDYDLKWIEEPLGAWDPEGYSSFRSEIIFLGACSEKAWTLEGLERVLATGTCDLMGVDPGRSEGIPGF